MQDLKIYIVVNIITIRQAIKQMDEGGIGFSVCVDENETVVGVISDGDFRRAILNGVELDEYVDKIMNRNFLYVNKNYQKCEVEEIFSGQVQHVPVLYDGKLLDIITRESFYGIKRKYSRSSLTNSVVIMAGGKGTRLDPFTRILPKPLIPLGDEPIIEIIMKQFREFGMKNFYVTLNDKGKMIKAYFHDYDANYHLNFVEEGKPLGTAGSLKLLQGKLIKTFFVSNCDIIIKSDYTSIFKFHRERGNAITLVGSMHFHTVPYGVCKIKNGGDLISISEKPEYDFLTNTGFYILEPEVLTLIPKDIYFDMTALIKKAQEKKLRVGVFPVSEKSWIDVGQWTEYNKALINQQ